MKSKLILQMFTCSLIGFSLACSEDEGSSITRPLCDTPPCDTTAIITDTTDVTSNYNVEEFRVLSGGKYWEAKIWIPAEYETNKDLPSIYLVDDEEQHYTVATDEFEKVIEGCKRISGFNALVITVADLDPDMNVVFDFDEFYDIYKNLASYVETNYTDNASRTLIGRGSAATMVLATLFLEKRETTVFNNFISTTVPGLAYFNEMMDKGNFPQDKSSKKLHFSFDGESDKNLNMKFINTLSDKAYPWLKFEWAEYPDMTFTTSYPTAYADGIEYIFKK